MSDSVLVQLTHGKGAHTDATACLLGLSAETAGTLAAGAPNSIFQIVFHINYWMDYELQRLAGGSPAYPEHAAESWPVTPAPRDATEWTASVERFKTLLAEMTRLGRDSATLGRPVVVTSLADHANMARTAGDVLIQTVVHNSYHLGQVAFLRRMLGVWPPATGSDTW